MTKSEEKAEEATLIKKKIEENLRMLDGLLNRYFLAAYEAGYKEAKEEKESYE